MTDLFIISFFVFGIWITFQEGMIFERAGNWMYANLPEFICKPLFECPVCQAWWYGWAYFWIMYPRFELRMFFIVVGAMGLNAILAHIMGYINIVSDKKGEDDKGA